MDLLETLSRIAGRIHEPLVVVDIGAQSVAGENHVYAPLYRLGVSVRVIGFEPLADRAACRRQEAAAGGDVTILEAFVGDGRTHPFHTNNSGPTSSLLELDRDTCGGFVSLRNLRTVETQPVETARLDTLLGGIPAIDFMKIDIQGFEFPALREACDVLSRTAMIQCETEFVPIYSGQALFSEVELHLRSHGFDFLDFHAPAYRAPVVPSGRVRNEQLLWADAVFGARIATASDRMLLAEAVIAAALYGKLSVAERALAAYDARHGTELAAELGPFR